MSTEWSTIEPTKATEEEKIEIEIEGEEEQQAAAPEVEVEKEAEPEQPKVEEVEAKSEEEPKELEGVETSGAQKRIRQLVKQKKEREEEIEKLLEANKQYQQQLQEREKEYQKAVISNAESSQVAVAERLELARESYKRAVDSQDADQILRAQEILNAAQTDVTRIQEHLKQVEEMKAAQQATPQVEQQQYQQPQQETYQGYDMKAVQWASKNEWFNSDQVMTAAALTIDAQLKEEGYDPTEDDYYMEVDKRMAETFPHKFGGTTAVETPVQQETSTPAQVVAGASRTPASPSSKKVKLTKEDVRLAEKWGISLEQYAQEKMKIEKSDGEYTPINR